MKPKAIKGATKAHILNVASNLFYRVGIRAVGIDTIVAESDVAKTTLYDHFASKDALIHAYLEQNDHIFWEIFEGDPAQQPDDPKQQLLAIFDRLDALIAAPESLGCPFLSAAAEFPELDQPGHRSALTHKQKVWSRFHTIAQAIGVSETAQFADQLLLLLDGAFASKRVFRSYESPARQLKSTVQMLLAAHLAQPN
ncbi:MAG: TetR/AcrR family transcriptional regulator [Armatimonadetes bacterium]|nr:TetR/AcrR family transcriptional regulator [Anaerolineae bacterium]